MVVVVVVVVVVQGGWEALLYEKLLRHISNVSMVSLNQQVDLFLNGIYTELDP